MKITGKYLKWLSEIFFGSKILRSVAAIVGVTAEICNYEVKRSGNKIKFYLVNGNGIAVSSVPLRAAPKFDGKNLELLCVAHVAKWHGLDRLIEGMAQYDKSSKVTLHIVGDGSEIPNLKLLVSKLGLEQNVLFHGFKAGKELDNFFDKCHIAVGSLGIHRIGLNEASVLKVREYCARGIPFIYGAKDPDFPKDFPYCLKVTADDTPVNINKIINFARKIRVIYDHPQKMREYAQSNLDWMIKMKQLKEFLEKVQKSM